MVAVLPTVVSAYRPDTTPEADPTEAIAGALLVQMPPPDVLLNVAVWPTHIAAIPLLAGGDGITVIVVVVWQLPIA